ncbi:MAG: hypothetical protein HQK79_20260 [Desulfobacterales bacterium]|nr:hypothetical protein [Desulfobacterales bacterium]
MQLPQATFCPLIKENCITTNCKFFQGLMGKNPQTGKDVNEYECVFVWLPLLLVENSQQQRLTAKAVDSFNNDMTKQNMQGFNIVNSVVKNLIGIVETHGRESLPNTAQRSLTCG